MRSSTSIIRLNIVKIALVATILVAIVSLTYEVIKTCVVPPAESVVVAPADAARSAAEQRQDEIQDYLGTPHWPNR